MLINIIVELNFKKSIEKIKAPKTKELILEQLKKLKINPFEGKKMTGNLRHLHSLRFGSKPQYRLIYEIKSCPLCGQNMKNKLSCETITPNQSTLCVSELIIHGFTTREDAYK